MNILELRNQPLKAKAGVATHIMGSYDFATHTVMEELQPIEIGNQESYVLHNEELLQESIKLFEEIQEITNQMQEVKVEPQGAQEALITWNRMDDDRAQIKRWIGSDVSDEFFYLGNLRQVWQLAADPAYRGTEEEKAKYEMLQMLSYNLHLLEVRTNYRKTFENMHFIPLAIQNISSITDSDIRIVVYVETGESVEPDKHLIYDDYEGMQGLLCRDEDDEKDIGVMAELFLPIEDGVIHVESAPYDPSTYTPKVPIYNRYGFHQPQKTEEDYKDEMEEYIASTYGRGYYEFDVSNLRSGECKWLCCGLLMKPIDGKVALRYQIHSACSAGTINRRIVWKSNDLHVNRYKSHKIDEDAEN